VKKLIDNFCTKFFFENFHREKCQKIFKFSSKTKIFLHPFSQFSYFIPYLHFSLRLNSLKNFFLNFFAHSTRRRKHLKSFWCELKKFFFFFSEYFYAKNACKSLRSVMRGGTNRKGWKFFSQTISMAQFF
jgi:hypothetical protein